MGQDRLFQTEMPAPEASWSSSLSCSQHRELLSWAQQGQDSAALPWQLIPWLPEAQSPSHAEGTPSPAPSWLLHPFPSALQVQARCPAGQTWHQAFPAEFFCSQFLGKNPTVHLLILGW